MSDDPRLGIGGNDPPLRERLEEEVKPLATRRDVLAVAAAKVPEKIIDAETAQRATDLTGQIAVARKAVIDLHAAEKKPFLDAGRVVDAVCFPLRDSLDAMKTLLSRKLAGYQQQRADRMQTRRPPPVRGDLGVVAAAQERWQIEIVDRKTLDLNALRPFLSEECLMQAIRHYARDGHMKLRGAKIERVMGVSVRT